MSYNVSFISLGCAKNQVNCEQMMALCAEAGYSIQAQPEGCDVVVVNTCGFLASACEEAIENILEMAELKKAGQVKKILVTGCMTQRYKEDIFHELPEVDGLLGTGSYGDIATAIAEVMEKGEKPCHLGNIHTANQSGERILSTPPWYAYLRIAEGCDNHCAATKRSWDTRTKATRRQLTTGRMETSCGIAQDTDLHNGRIGAGRKPCLLSRVQKEGQSAILKCSWISASRSFRADTKPY